MRPDGSGLVFYGFGLSHAYDFPKDTIDCSGFLAYLKLHEGGNGRDHFGYTLTHRNEERPPVYSLAPDFDIEPLIKTAIGHSRDPDSGFEFLREHPLPSSTSRRGAR